MLLIEIDNNHLNHSKFLINGHQLNNSYQKVYTKVNNFYNSCFFSVTFRNILKGKISDLNALVLCGCYENIQFFSVGILLLKFQYLSISFNFNSNRIIYKYFKSIDNIK